MILAKQKQWVKIWGMYRKAVGATTYVKEVNINNGREAESNAIINTTFHYKNK